MRILVEDNTNCFPYQLLVPLYGDKIMGSMSNNSLDSYMQNLYSKVLIYVDVCPDKHNTCMLFNHLFHKAKKLDEVYVLPIPCIEYYFVYAFIHNNCKSIDTVLHFGNYKGISYNEQHKTLSTGNFEKFCKSVIAANKTCYNNNKYVTSDCNCKWVSSRCERLQLDNKRLRFLYSLPTFPLLSDFSVSKERYSYALNKCIDMYYEAGRHFVNFGIIREIPKLVVD